MRKLLSTALLSGILVASCANAATPNYTVTLPLTEDEDGLMAYITNYDTGEKVDSVIVDGGQAIFRGNIDNSIVARILVDGDRMGMCILEPGTITLDAKTRVASGTLLNDRMIDLNNRQAELVKEYRALPDGPASDARKAEIQQEFNNLLAETLEQNANNALGYYLFMQDAYNWDLAQLEQKLTRYPQFGSSKRINTLKQALLNKEETSVGHKFKDFEITYDGKTSRLSDYVGKGKYTLVDFWASWCGPCIRETKVLKELYNKYNPQGLEILGVAVWDEPANTLKAIEQHQLPWNQIINAQTIPTDIYGISGIPCIILFDPEGNIVSRDKQDEELVKDVTDAMNAWAASKAQ